ncbi:MAG: tol-pal system-associated acyl-CoA thioesterase [Roseinatronobacter sp.]
MHHLFPVRVYYEDTDLAGIVYYANYLRFIERGRSEWLRDLGFDQAQLKARGGGVFAVRRVHAEYRAPARFDDLLTVQTRYLSHSGARLILHQQVTRADTLLFDAEVTLVCISEAGRPLPLPPALTEKIGGNAPTSAQA